MFEQRYSDSCYFIEKLHEHDDGEQLRPWKRILHRAAPLSTLLAVGAYILYFGYRIRCTMDAQRSYHKTYIMAWIFIAAEGAVTCKYHSFITPL